MHASFSVSGFLVRRLPAVALAATLLSLSFSSPMKLAAQEADGGFEGERTWTDKDGKTHDVKAPDTKKDSKIRAIFRKLYTEGKTSSDAEEELFNNWAQSVIRPLTWKENIAKLPEIRKDLKKYLIQLSKSAAPNLHDRLNDLTLQICTEAIKDVRYPRAVRINCILMLADLDQREHNAGAQQPAVPLPGATSALVELLADEKQPLFIRFESIIAFTRHVQPAMPAAMQGQAAEALLKIMTSPIAEDRRLDGQAWIRLRASYALLAMIEHKLPVDQAALAGGLATLLAYENLPFWARASCAGDLGKLDGKSLSPDKVGPTVQTLDGLVLAILQSSPFMPDEQAAEEAAEDASAKSSRDKASRSRDAAAGNRGASADKKDSKKDEKKDGGKEEKKEEKKEEISPAAQKLLSEEMMWQLARIRQALYGKDAPAARNDRPDDKLGLYAAANDADKAAIKKIVDQLDKCVKVLAEVPDSLDKVADTLRGANQELEGLFAAPVAEEQQTAMADQEDGAATPSGSAAAGNADKQKR